MTFVASIQMNGKQLKNFLIIKKSKEEKPAFEVNEKSFNLIKIKEKNPID